MNLNESTRVTVDYKIVLELSETEARALRAICGYEGGAQGFLEVFYSKFGKSYLKPYAKGVEGIFKAVKENLPQSLHRVDRIKSAINQVQKENHSNE